MKKYLTIAPLLAAVVLAAGCGNGGGEATAPSAPAELPPALAAVFAKVSSEATPRPIPELRRTAKPGDEIVLEAKVMGTKKPFVDNRAVFVVGDEGTLTSCDLLHADQCHTPWDACCDDTDALLAGTATIQVVDTEGGILRHSIKGVSGLKELTRLRIAGVVAPNSSETAFIINATHIEIL